VPPAGFETAIPASERPQTYALDRARPPVSAYVKTVSNERKAVQNCVALKVLVTSVWIAGLIRKIRMFMTDSSLILQHCFMFRGFMTDNEMEK
jgi:hypothetical protein